MAYAVGRMKTRYLYNSVATYGEKNLAT
jgi:hypothetical protein